MSVSALSWMLSSDRVASEPKGKNGVGVKPNSQIDPVFRGFFSSDIRSEASEDYRRVLLSYPFRALQDKTQVFSLDWECCVRTRLTHSYEVSATAQLLFEWLWCLLYEGRRDGKGAEEPPLFSAPPSDEVYQELRFSLMAACLLHDAGNPPFGHFGEFIISDWFLKAIKESDSPVRNTSGELLGDLVDTVSGIDYGLDLANFEGNAQSLRIALRASHLFDGHSLNLTATTISSLVKYPYCCKGRDTGGKKSKFNIFRSDEMAYRMLLERSGLGSSMIDDGIRHPLSLLLEAADDISYATSDLEDAFSRGLFSVTELLVYMCEMLTEEKGKKTEYAAILALLAFVAGSHSDKEHVTAVFSSLSHKYAQKGIDTIKQGIGAEALCGRTYSAYIDELNEGSLSILTSRKRREIQAQYFSQWIDIVRKWLVHSAAYGIRDVLSKSVASSALSETEGLFDDERRLILRAMKMVMEHFVFDSKRNLKTNVAAKTILESLLNTFVPAVLRCENGFERRLYSSKDKDAHPSQTDWALIDMIPQKYKLDYEKKVKTLENPSAVRLRYERIMVVTDFICGMSDAYAKNLYKEMQLM